MRCGVVLAVALAATLGAASHPEPPSSNGGPAADPADDPLLAAVDSIAEAALARGPIAGLSIAVLRDDSLVVNEGYGFADLENRTPATPGTVYDIASVTKLLTATAVMRLVETGRLRLDDDLATLLPRFPNREQGARITIAHLLSHTSGLPDYEAADTERWLDRGTPLTEEFVLDFHRGRALDFEPGSRWSYSSSGYYFLASIVAEVTGVEHGRRIEEEVAHPLGLMETSPCDHRRAAERRSRGYQAVGDSLRPGRLYALPGLMGDGGICSTAADLARLPDALRRGRLIHDSTLARMTRPTVLADGTAVEYGFGVRRGELDGRPLWGHTGGMETYWATLAHYPDDRTTIVVLVNTDGGAEDALTIEGAVARVALGLAEPLLRDLPLARDQLDAFGGRYADGTGQIVVRSASSRLERVVPGSSRPARTLLYQGDDTFASVEYPMDRFRFHRVGRRVVGLSEFHNGIFATYRHAER